MRDIRFPQGAFSWFCSPSLSESMAGDLLEEGRSFGKGWFLRNSFYTLLLLFWNACKGAPFTIFTLAVFLHLLSLGLFQLTFPSTFRLLEWMDAVEYLGLHANAADGSIYSRPPLGWLLMWSLGVASLFMAGAIIALVSRHSMSGVVLNVLLFGAMRLVDLTYMYQHGHFSFLLTVVYFIQDLLYFLALLAGANFIHKRRYSCGMKAPEQE